MEGKKNIEEELFRELNLLTGTLRHLKNASGIGKANHTGFIAREKLGLSQTQPR